MDPSAETAAEQTVEGGQPARATQPQPSPADPDAALVRRAQAELPGESTAFEQLMDRHAAAIERRALRILRSRSDAEDAVQEVFMSAFRALPHFRCDRPFSHWLAVVVRNACRGILRRSGLEERRRAGLAAETAIESRPAAADPMLRRVLGELLEVLPGETRAAIEMRVLDERPHREIATALGMGESAVKMRIARGYEGLRRVYASREAEAHDRAALQA